MIDFRELLTDRIRTSAASFFRSFGNQESDSPAETLPLLLRNRCRPSEKTLGKQKKSMKNKGFKIVYVADNRLSLKKAAIVNIVEMCSAFSKNGFECTLMVPDCGMDVNYMFEYYGVTHPFRVVKIKTPRIFLKKVLPGLVTIFSFLSLRKLKTLRYDIVYTRIPLVFFVIAALRRKCCFYEAHQFKFNGFLQTRIYRKLVKSGMRSGNGRMVCISESLKNYWVNESIERTKICVAHDGVNIDKYASAFSKKIARRKLGYSDHKDVVVYTGSLIPGKGVDVLIKCANLLPEIVFIIVGGSEKNIRELKKLSNKSNVVFTGHVPPTKIPVYQACADVLALPNTKGGLIDDVTSPMKLFEYIAAKRPIVATDVPSILEVLKHDYNSLISPKGDFIELSKNIRRLFRNPELCEKLKENASNELWKYSWDERVRFLGNRFGELYN